MSVIERLKIKAKLLVKTKKKRGTFIRLKDALDSVAKIAGYRSWRELKNNPPQEEHFWQPTGVFPNHWCKTHEEAKAVLAKEGGYLLPHGKQFFVCPPEYLEAIGIQKNDPDLAHVGNDFAKPMDLKALQRLKEKIRPR